MRKEPLADRFWAKVHKTISCWEWTGAPYGGGYGRISRGGRNGKDERAHRLSWEMHFGPVPDGLCVLHRCDNRICVRPSHLFLGTIGDNNRDMYAKGRANPYDRSGDKNPAAKTTETQRDEIRRQYAAGGVLQRELAAEFGLTQERVSQIVRSANGHQGNQ